MNVKNLKKVESARSNKCIMNEDRRGFSPGPLLKQYIHSSPLLSKSLPLQCFMSARSLRSGLGQLSVNEIQKFELRPGVWSFSSIVHQTLPE